MTAMTFFIIMIIVGAICKRVAGLLDGVCAILLMAGGVCATLFGAYGVLTSLL